MAHRPFSHFIFRIWAVSIFHNNKNLYGNKYRSTNIYKFQNGCLPYMGKSNDCSTNTILTFRLICFVRPPLPHRYLCTMKSYRLVPAVALHPFPPFSAGCNSCRSVLLNTSRNVLLNTSRGWVGLEPLFSTHTQNVYFNTKAASNYWWKNLIFASFVVFVFGCCGLVSQSRLCLCFLCFGCLCHYHCCLHHHHPRDIVTYRPSRPKANCVKIQTYGPSVFCLLNNNWNMKLSKKIVWFEFCGILN